MAHEPATNARQVSTTASTVSVRRDGTVAGYRFDPARIVDGIPRLRTGDDREQALAALAALRCD